MICRRDTTCLWPNSPKEIRLLCNGFTRDLWHMYIHGRVVRGGLRWNKPPTPTCGATSLVGFASVLLECAVRNSVEPHHNRDVITGVASKRYRRLPYAFGDDLAANFLGGNTSSRSVANKLRQVVVLPYVPDAITCKNDAVWSSYLRIRYADVWFTRHSCFRVLVVSDWTWDGDRVTSVHIINTGIEANSVAWSACFPQQQHSYIVR